VEICNDPGSPLISVLAAATSRWPSEEEVIEAQKAFPALSCSTHVIPPLELVMMAPGELPGSIGGGREEEEEEKGRRRRGMMVLESVHHHHKGYHYHLRKWTLRGGGK